MYLNFKDNRLAGIYIHIPFCKQQCYYCDFHFSTNQSLKSEMVNAIGKELELQKNYLGDNELKTLYFGGGTPSLLSEAQISYLLETIYVHYPVHQHAEITFECNPDDLDMNKLQALKSLGINRLSIGIQSFDNQVLGFLNRAHNSEEATQCINDARDTGFDNISLDLIYGIPDRSDDIWEQDLAKALAFKPEHLSTYCLTIEPATVFGRWEAQGKLEPVSEEFAARQYEIMTKVFQSAGYEHYEVSNFCLSGHESKHNSAYWQQVPYLGVGPSAHSYNGEHRQSNISHNKKYIDALQSDQIPFELDVLTKKDKINDLLLTGLRTKWGVNLQLLKEAFDFDLYQENNRYIDQLMRHDKAFIQQDHLILTEAGLLIADQITSDLFVV
ncbi:MAG: radical SAM family heme chaperone HemW [Fulvivirga sp.]|nr:radical SAM family heme chaperone HemW [Fulvivirga sp.]